MMTIKNSANEMSGFDFSQRAKTIFTGAILGLFLSKGLALVPGYGLDDYLILNEGKNPLHLLAQGRYTHAAILQLLNYLDVSATSIAWPIIMLFFVAAASAITLGILFVTRSKGPVMPQAGIAAIIGAHPYLTEYFSFRESLVAQGPSFVLLALVFALILNSEKIYPKPGLGLTILWLTIPLLALAGVQQTTFIIASFFIFSRFIIDAVMIGGVNGIKQSLHNNSTLFIAFLFSAFIYVILFLLSQKLAGAVHDDRASLISIAEIPFRLNYLVATLKITLLESQPILSSTVKLLLLATMIGFTIQIGLTKPQVAIGCVVLFIVLTVGSLFLVMISAIWWPAPRAMYGIGFSFGLTLTAISIWLGKGQKLFMGMILVVAMGLIFHSNAMLHDQFRLNRWDLWTAGAIAQDLAIKGVKTDQQVFLAGVGSNYPAGPKTTYGDINLSALSMSWSTKYIMKEATGRDWNIATVEGTPDVCPQNSPLWPSPESIHIRPQEVVVCMGYPESPQNRP